MKKILSILLVLCATGTTAMSQSIYELSLRTIHGHTLNLSQFQNKKILIMLIPLHEGDTLFNQLSAFKSRYGDTVAVIGIPSLEDGYLNEHASALTGMYAALGIVLMEGMHTRNTSTGQSPLFQWLTDKTKNRYGSPEVLGIGHKFFVNESGRLYAVIRPQTSLQSVIVDRIVHSNAH